MRILKVTQSYAPFFEFGGPPVKVRALAEGLARRGHDVTVLTADWGLDRRLPQSNAGSAEASPFGRRWRSNGVTAEYLANWLHYRASSWNPALSRYLNAGLKNFDIVHIYGLYDLFGPRVAERCRLARLPYVVEPIGMYLPIVRNIWLKRLYHRIWGQDMLHGASAIVATAEQERNELIRGGLPETKILLRRNGVQAPEHFPDRGKFRASLRIPPDARLILFLGRLSQKKSPELLLQAFAGLPQSDALPAVHLAFVGPDESGMLSKLKLMARELHVAERAHFSGPREAEEKWSAYRDADIFVLPSQNENFGNTAAEAIAAGTPVVVTDQCGIAPLLANRAGLVVRHNQEDLVKALHALLNDQDSYAQFRNGCSAVLSTLGWDEPVTQMEVTYSRLASLPRS